jgi:protein-S-isoprenylcysteine O-methyltransferase Ste14
MGWRQTWREHHEGRDGLAGEHPAGDAGQAILALLFVVIWVLDTFFLHYTTGFNGSVPLGIRVPLGVALLVVSGYLVRSGLSIAFGERRETPGVIREGVFNIVRHPIYLSEIVLYLGCLMLSLSLAAASVLFVATVFLHYISRHEEKLLLARFGEEYARYMRDVPMWIPRLRKKPR